MFNNRRPSTVYWDYVNYSWYYADEIKASAGTMVEIGGLLYTYWHGNKTSDCYDDAVIWNVPGGVPC